MNIILLVSDTFRYDHLGFHGNKWIDTRDLDAFARKCAVFDNCYTGSFPTIPQRTDMVTGRYIFPYAGWCPLKPDWIPVSEYLHDAGFVTQLICDTPHLLSRDHNFHRGFDAYYWERGQEGDAHFTRMNDPIVPVMPHEKTRRDYALRPAPKRKPGIPFNVTLADRHRWVNRRWAFEEDRFTLRTARHAVRWLEENYTCKNFFLWVDTFDAHEPWDPPEYIVRRYDPDYTGTPMIHPNYGHAGDYTPAELKNLRAHYAGEVHLVSKALGQIIRKVEEVGLMDNTAIIFTSDHGMMLGEHDMVGKANINPDDERIWKFYREVTHVPLMIYAPGIRPRRIKSVVQPVDIMPTIMELAGEKLPGGLDGRSLYDVITGRATSVRRCAITAAWALEKSHTVTIQDTSWSLVVGLPDTKERRAQWELQADAPPVMELYNTKEDPGQKKNLLRKDPARARRMLNYLNSFMSEHGSELNIVPGK